MISNIKRIKIDAIVASIVLSSFSMFCSPKYKGQNFTWDRFTDIVTKEIESQLFLYFDNTPTTEMYNYAKNKAKELACLSVDNSGFLDKL